MPRQSKKEPIPFQISLAVQYAMEKRSSFYEGILRKKTEPTYKQLEGRHAYHREFLDMSIPLENAARKYAAEWHVEKVRKKPEERLDRLFRFRASDRFAARYDGAYSDLLYQVATLTSSAVVGLKLIKAIQPAIVQWLKSREGTTLRVKVGTSEVSVRGKQDIDEILKLLDKVASRTVQKATPRSTRKSASSTKRQTSSRKQTKSKKTRIRSAK